MCIHEWHISFAGYIVCIRCKTFIERTSVSIVQSVLNAGFEIYPKIQFSRTFGL